MLTLTHHKKSVRAMALHPKEYVANVFAPAVLYIFLFNYMYNPVFLKISSAKMDLVLCLSNHLNLLIYSFLWCCRNLFASASADNIKKFTLPKGEFMHNML